MCDQKLPVILHISDLHFGWDGGSAQGVIRREVALGQLVRALQNLDPEWRPNLVCITGDLAGLGKPDNYTLAGQWLGNILTQLGISKDRVLICAGNHDVDRDIELPSTRPQQHTKADAELAVPIKEEYVRRFHALVEQPSCDFKTVHLRYHDIEQNNIEAFDAGEPKCVCAVISNDRIITSLTHRLREKACDAVIIFYNQNSHITSL